MGLLINNLSTRIFLEMKLNNENCEESAIMINCVIFMITNVWAWFCQLILLNWFKWESIKKMPWHLILQ